MTHEATTNPEQFSTPVESRDAVVTSAEQIVERAILGPYWSALYLDAQRGDQTSRDFVNSLGSYNIQPPTAMGAVIENSVSIDTQGTDPDATPAEPESELASASA